MTQKRFSKVFLFLFSFGLIIIGFLKQPTFGALKEGRLRIGVSFPEARSKEPLDGRILLLISTDGAQEPRFQINDGPNTQLVFGIDVDGLKPQQVAVFDESVFGYPVQNIMAIPAGEYWVQALLNRYETFRRADGCTVKLPMDRGEGQQWNQKPGNLLSAPQKIFLDPKKDGLVKISLDQEIPAIPDPKDTKYIKHVRIQSKLLSQFWGRPMSLGANVLLPEGFESHPKARYPLIIFHGHFPYTFSGFRETPPDPNLKPEYSELFKIEGYNKMV